MYIARVSLVGFLDLRVCECSTLGRDAKLFSKVVVPPSAMFTRMVSAVELIMFILINILHRKFKVTNEVNPVEGCLCFQAAI